MNRRLSAGLVMAALATAGETEHTERVFSPRRKRKRGPLNRSQERERRRRQIESGMLRPNCRDFNDGGDR